MSVRELRCVVAATHKGQIVAFSMGVGKLNECVIFVDNEGKSNNAGALG
ncbi:hypothetical protein [Schaalia odontolytica]